ncbi:unnamed protein product [Brassicogethes aeneus]|uniref:C2H2-type domain-containing protein n=1 Tax=Brassicogethes aeneus TaxID=1431903 RepID=A0A9P0FEF6_BRAAE|nr:unnamed protein product [Brassicogethes aeneus]
MLPFLYLNSTSVFQDFITANQHIIHLQVQVQRNDERFKCEDCEYSGTWKELLNHKNSGETCKDTKNKKRKGPKTHYCMKCKFSTSSFNEFQKHNLSCVNLPFKCYFCEFKSFSQFPFEIHVYGRHKKQNDTEKRHVFKNELFSCDKCEHVGVKSGAQHVCDPRKVKLKQLKKHHCEHCNFSCTEKFSLRQHCCSLHKTMKEFEKKGELFYQSKSNYYECPYCQFFRAAKILTFQKHVLNKHWEQNYVEKKVNLIILQCNQCPFSTLKNGKLWEHVLQCHKGTSLKNAKNPVIKHDKKLKECKKSLYKCVQCPYETASVLDVVDHQNTCKEVIANIDTNGLYKVKRVKQKDHQNTCKEVIANIDTNGLFKVKRVKQKDHQNTCKEVIANIDTNGLFKVKRVKQKDHQNTCKEVVANIDTNEISTCNKQVLNINAQQECPYCDFQAPDMYNLKLHVCQDHKEQNKVEKKVDTSIKKYYISCKNDSKRQTADENTFTKDGTCPYCPIIIKRIFFLQKHVYFNHREQNEAEKKCKFSSYFLKKFSSIETRKSCPYCNYKAKFHLQRHVYRLHKEQNEIEKKVKITIKINYCDNCSYSHTDHSAFQRHAKKCKKDGPLLQCPDCTYSTNSNEKLNTHVKHHTNPELTCSFCPFTTKSRSSFSNHKRKHKAFKVKTSNKRHSPRDMPTQPIQKPFMVIKKKVRGQKSSRRKLTCPYCNHETYRNRDLYGHVISMHLEQHEVEKKLEITCKMYSCDNCKFSTLTKKYFNRHAKVCKKLNGPILTCPYCTFITTLEDRMKRHVKKHIVINCVYCDYTSTDNGYLQSHIFAKHKEQNELENKVAIKIKTYSCAYCNFSTPKNQSLQRHIMGKHREQNDLENKVAIRITTFSCVYCDFTTVRNQVLQTHIFKNHKEQNELENKVPIRLKFCEYCEFSTVGTQALQRHVFANHNEQNEMEKKVPENSNTCRYDECAFTGQEHEVTQHMVEEHKYERISTIIAVNCPYCSF